MLTTVQILCIIVFLWYKTELIKTYFLMQNMFPYRTDALLVKLSLLMGQEVFYGALWGSVLVSPSIRLPASLFVVSHINRELSGKQQKFMLGTDYKLTVSSLLSS